MARIKHWLLLSILVFITYGNSVTNGYNIDDSLVTQNHAITSTKSRATLVDVFTKPYYADKAGYSYGYRPIALFSFYLENRILGEHAAVSHFLNILIFALTTLLIYYIIAQFPVNNASQIALISSIIFIVHPIHTEAVNSIKNRDELLSLLFALCSFWLIIKYNSKGYIILLCSGLLFGLALLSKKSVMPLAFIFPYYFALFEKNNAKVFYQSSAIFITAVTFFGGIINHPNDIYFYIFCALYLASGVVIIYKQNISKAVKYLVFNTAFLITFCLGVVTIVIIMVLITKNYTVLLVSAPAFYYVYIKQKNIALYLIMVAFLAIDVIAGFANFGLIGVFISAGVLLTKYYKKQTSFGPEISFLVSISLYLIIHKFNLKNLIIIVWPVLFFYLYNRKKLFAIILMVFVTGGSILNNNIPVLGLLMLIVILSQYTNYNKTTKAILSPIVLATVFILTIIWPTIKIQPTHSSEITQQNLNISAVVTSTNKATFNEGRSLEFIENPLIESTSKTQKIYTGINVLGEYMRLHFFPYQLSFYYGFDTIEISDKVSIPMVIWLLIHLLIITVAFLTLKNHPIISFGIGWYLACILLFSNWVELVAGIVGERLAYSASVGFSIVIANIGVILFQRIGIKKEIKLLVVSTILGVFFIQTICRNRLWETPLKLMKNDIKHSGNSAQAHNMYAVALMSEAIKNQSIAEKKLLIEDAKTHFSNAISIYPRFFNAYVDLARISILEGNLKEAKRYFVLAYIQKPANLLVLEELIKVSFDLNDATATAFYTNKYLVYDSGNEKVYELAAHIMLVNGKKQLAFNYVKAGLQNFPNNQALNYLNSVLSN